MYSKITHDIRVTVEPYYIEEESIPADNHHFWAYHVRIENLGKKKVQLKTRSWEITDSEGLKHTVQGDGVVGQQPEIEPGKMYEYTSGVPLNTQSAIMEGKYSMNDEEGLSFDIEIPAFSLDSPYYYKKLH